MSLKDRDWTRMAQYFQEPGDAPALRRFATLLAAIAENTSDVDLPRRTFADILHGVVHDTTVGDIALALKRTADIAQGVARSLEQAARTPG